MTETKVTISICKIVFKKKEELIKIRNHPKKGNPTPIKKTYPAETQ
jgi:hypothetical protein